MASKTFSKEAMTFSVNAEAVVAPNEEELISHHVPSVGWTHMFAVDERTHLFAADGRSHLFTETDN